MKFPVCFFVLEPFLRLAVLAEHHIQIFSISLGFVRHVTIPLFKQLFKLLLITRHDTCELPYDISDLFKLKKLFHPAERKSVALKMMKFVEILHAHIHSEDLRVTLNQGFSFLGPYNSAQVKKESLRQVVLLREKFFVENYLGCFEKLYWSKFFFDMTNSFAKPTPVIKLAVKKLQASPEHALEIGILSWLASPSLA